MPDAGTIFSQAYAPFLALGVGGVGGRAAAQGGLEGFGEEPLWAACDTHPARLLATGLEHKLLLALPPGFPLSASAARAIAENADSWRRLIRWRLGVILFGALGEAETAGILPPLCQFLKEEGRFVCVIGAQPFALEDPARQGTARRAAQRIVPLADLFLPLSSPSLAGPPDADDTPEAAAQAASQALLGAVQALLGVLANAGAADAFSLEHLRETLGGAGPMRASVGAGQGAQAPRTALEEALKTLPERNEPLEGASAAPRGISSRLSAMIVSGREMTRAESGYLGRRLRQSHTPGVPAASAALTRLGLSTEAALGGEARCLAVLGPAPSPNVIPLAAAE